MYDYPQYKEPDRETLIDFMRQHPFVTLIASDSENRIEVTQIPVLVDDRDGKIFLLGHIARKSDHEAAIRENAEVLILFTSPHVYVSGSWYTGNPQQASTWNYISIHARGRIEFKDEPYLIALLKRLSLHFENDNKNSSTIFDNLPQGYLTPLIKAIVGFEMEVTELDNVFKLSQNRDEKSYYNIIEKLEQQGGDAKYIASEMKKRTPRKP